MYTGYMHVYLLFPYIFPFAHRFMIIISSSGVIISRARKHFSLFIDQRKQIQKQNGSSVTAQI